MKKFVYSIPYLIWNESLSLRILSLSISGKSSKTKLNECINSIYSETLFIILSISSISSILSILSILSISSILSILSISSILSVSRLL